MAKNQTPKGPKPDPLTREELSARFGFALKVIYSNSELARLFETAVKQQWTGEKFNAEVRNTQWYQQNNQYAREAWVSEQLGGADWAAKVDNAKLAVQAAATEVGADLSPEELDSLSRQYVYQGWDQPSRQTLLMRALAEQIEVMPQGKGLGRGLRGRAGSFTDQLKAEALANGLRYSDDWYVEAARSVASGLTTEDDWRRDVREQAASMFPVFGDRIRQGMSAYDLASPYINMMAQTFEIAPDQIQLSDPYIKEALMGVDEQGNPRAMGLWDFQKRLRNDPRWMKTKQASDEIGTVATDIMRVFGLRG